MNGYWLGSGVGFQQPPGSSFNFNSSMISGNYTYVVPSGKVCPNAQTIVPVNIINSPNVGTPNPQSICINNYGIGNLYDLSNLLVGNPDPGTWYEGGVPVYLISIQIHMVLARPPSLIR